MVQRNDKTEKQYLPDWASMTLNAVSSALLTFATWSLLGYVIVLVGLVVACFVKTPRNKKHNWSSIGGAAFGIALWWAFIAWGSNVWGHNLWLWGANRPRQP